MCVKENSTALACFWFAVCGHVDTSMNGCRRFTGNELGRIYPWEKKKMSLNQRQNALIFQLWGKRRYRRPERVRQFYRPSSFLSASKQNNCILAAVVKNRMKNFVKNTGIINMNIYVVWSLTASSTKQVPSLLKLQWAAGKSYPTGFFCLIIHFILFNMYEPQTDKWLFLLIKRGWTCMGS